MKLLTALLLVLSLTPVSAQELLSVPAEQTGYDADRGFLLLRLDSIPRAVYPGGITVADTIYTFIRPYDSLPSPGFHPAVSSEGDTVSIGFTTLPIIRIDAGEVLNAKNKVASEFHYDDSEQSFSSTIGIRYRGSFTLRLPKKSLDLEFWNNEEERETVDVRFAGLRKDDDWVLDALHNEPMRVNSYVAHKLWLDWHRPYYAEREDKAKSGADVTFVEVFFEGGYQGVHLLSEQVDRKQLKLKKLKEGRLCGELYKGVDWTDATLFNGQPPLPPAGQAAYDGWELKYPDEDDLIDWSGLHDLLGFVEHSSDSVFTAEVADRFQQDNLIDYLLYLNVVGLKDNKGKNAYLAKYDATEPYFYAPWDLDVSFGNYFDGTRVDDTDFWISNGLFDRLGELEPEGFYHKLCDRYQSLRSGLLATDSLLARLDTARLYLKANGVYERENMRWGNTRSDEEQVQFTRRFVSDRLAYLDGYICTLSPVAEPPAAAESISLYPNPANNEITVRHPGTAVGDYRIIGPTGAVVRSGTLAPRKDVLTVADLPPGVYLLQIGRLHHRFVRI